MLLAGSNTFGKVHSTPLKKRLFKSHRTKTPCLDRVSPSPCHSRVTQVSRGFKVPLTLPPDTTRTGHEAALVTEFSKLPGRRNAKKYVGDRPRGPGDLPGFDPGPCPPRGHNAPEARGPRPRPTPAAPHPLPMARQRGCARRGLGGESGLAGGLRAGARRVRRPRGRARRPLGGQGLGAGQRGGLGSRERQATTGGDLHRLFYSAFSA